MVFIAFKLLLVIAGVGAILFAAPAGKDKDARETEAVTASVSANDTIADVAVPWNGPAADACRSSSITCPSSNDDLIDEQT